MTGRTRIFLDTSVLLAAAGSPTGGSSAALVLLTDSDVYEAVVSPQVLREPLANLRAKFDRLALARFYGLVGELRPGLVQASGPAEVPPTVPFKDHHVLVACSAGAVSVCLTLDRRHLLTEQVRRWGLGRGLRLLTPGEFLEWQRAAGEGEPQS